MKINTRLAVAGAGAVLAISLVACAAGASTATSTTAAAPPASATASNGVTTPAQVFGAGCAGLPQGLAAGGLTAMGPLPVAAAASTNPLLTTLVGAVGKVNGLADTLNNAPAITVFAPANDAFAAVDAATLNALLEDPPALAALLQYHVVGKRYDKDGLLAAGTTTALTGGSVTIAANGDTLTVTDAKGNVATVLCGNIPTKNATVFVIDKVLVP